MADDEKPADTEDIGRKLGKAFRRARPAAEKLAADAKPRAEKAFNDALQFAKDHEDEGRQIAQQLVRARLTGPVGMVIGALAPELDPSKPTSRICPSCQTINTLSANFCNECGTRLQQPPS